MDVCEGRTGIMFVWVGGVFNLQRHILICFIFSGCTSDFSLSKDCHEPRQSLRTEHEHKKLFVLVS